MNDEDPQFYDRQGVMITHDEARDLIGQGLDRVARTSITDASNPAESLVVSTIWMGVDIELGDYPQPMIFQTVVFDRNHDRIDEVCSATEEHALQAHQVMVEEHTKKMVDAVVVDLTETED